MGQGHDEIRLEDVLKLARRLSAIDKVRLIERVAPEVERDLVTRRAHEGRSLRGLLKDLGPAPSAEQIDAARDEVWASFPRDDF